MSNINFREMDVGFDEKTSEFLNACLKHRNNLEKVFKDEIFDIWEEKSVEGTATLSFNQKGVLLRTSKNLFS